MKENSNLIRVYSGTELTVNLLKEELEGSGIPSMIQNDFNSGISSQDFRVVSHRRLIYSFRNVTWEKQNQL